MGEFLWKTTSRVSRYAANRIPEIADTIVEIDNAIKWGFGWAIGVFEAWDAIGVRESVERMRAEGQAVPESVEKMLAAGAETFYKNEDGQQSFYDLVKGEYRPMPDRQGVIVLKSVKERTGVIKSTPGPRHRYRRRRCVSRIHSKMNSIGGDTVSMMNFAFDAVERIQRPGDRNQGGISARANIMMLLLAARKRNGHINLMIRPAKRGDGIRTRKPVVTAPYGLALGAVARSRCTATRSGRRRDVYRLVRVGVG